MKRFGVNKLGSLELDDGFHHERGNVDEFNLVEEWSSSDSVLMLFRNIRNNRPLVVAGHHEVKESMSGEVQFSHRQGNVNGRFQFDKKFSCDLNGIVLVGIDTGKSNEENPVIGNGGGVFFLSNASSIKKRSADNFGFKWRQNPKPILPRFAYVSCGNLEHASFARRT